MRQDTPREEHECGEVVDVERVAGVEHLNALAVYLPTRLQQCQVPVRDGAQHRVQWRA